MEPVSFHETPLFYRARAWSVDREDAGFVDREDAGMDPVYSDP